MQIYIMVGIYDHKNSLGILAKIFVRLNQIKTEAVIRGRKKTRDYAICVTRTYGGIA